MTMPLGCLARVLLGLAAASVTLLISVGAVDLWRGQSFLHASMRGARMHLRDAERNSIARDNKGAYATALDPAVSITMTRGQRREILGVAAGTDAEGQRLRRGPSPASDAQRIIVLGDSVAFGFGVADDQTIAHHLEDYLAQACGTRPWVRTIACPGWNTRNACRYLLNRLGELRPELVIYLPIGNDLHDSYTTSETGYRILSHDPRRGTATPHSSLEGWQILLEAHHQNISTAGAAGILGAGGPAKTIQHCVLTGLTPESQRRWEQLGDDLSDLHGRIHDHGGRLFVGFTAVDDYTRQVHQLLTDRGLDDALGYTLTQHRPLANDPHPDPVSTRAIAWCLADQLIRGGQIRGADRSQLPPMDPRLADRRAYPATAEERRSALATRTSTWARYFTAHIDLPNGIGMHQVYGGVHADRMVGRALWCALKNPAPGQSHKLQLHLDRLPRDSGIYPLTLYLEVNGRTLPTTLELPPPSDPTRRRIQISWRIPVEYCQTPYLDLLIRPDNRIREVHLGSSRLVSFGLGQISLGD